MNPELNGENTIGTELNTFAPFNLPFWIVTTTTYNTHINNGFAVQDEQLPNRIVDDLQILSTLDYRNSV
ncbi:hypothetical protein [Chryseobacterium gregarium]|uniref:hypothetical protein n=1 Tax=Chryseobacterium gregarium TaxID=456299 RepID=UPI000488F306|nr:hypothetical protein [Chryseobacterium gregarium]